MNTLTNLFAKITGLSNEQLQEISDIINKKQIKLKEKRNKPIKLKEKRNKPIKLNKINKYRLNKLVGNDVEKLKELLLESYKQISDVDELAKLCPICYKLIDFCFDNDFKNCPNCDVKNVSYRHILLMKLIQIMKIMMKLIIVKIVLKKIDFYSIFI